MQVLVANAGRRALVIFVISAVAVLGLSGVASAASNKSQVWYQPTATGDSWVNNGQATIGANYLASHSGTIDAGSLPGASISAFPWKSSAGDTCNEHRFSGSAGSATDQPFTAHDTTAALSFMTGLPKRLITAATAGSYQIGDPTGGTWASACQAINSNWGFWLNAGDANGQNLTPGGWCATGCGDEHDISFGNNKSVRPWNTGAYGSSPVLQVTGTYRVKNYTYNDPSAGAWLPICLILEDTATNQIMQDCVDRQGYAGADGSIAGGSDDNWAPHPQKWIEINSLIDNTTPYLSPVANTALSNPAVAPEATPQSYGFTISAAQLLTNVRAINKNPIMRGCVNSSAASSYVGEKECFSTVPSNYQLLGIGDGVEMWNSSSTLGAMTTAPTVQTLY